MERNNIQQQRMEKKSMQFSIKAHVLKLNNSQAGGVASKCTTSTSVYTSSFEAELDGITSSFKTASRLMDILDEMYYNIQQSCNSNK